VHAYAKEYDPRTGNERATEACLKHPAFVPCYVLLPEHTGEMASGDALLRYLAEGGARAARLYPKEHSYGLGETWCGGLFGTLAEAGVPVLIDFDQTSWPEVDGVLTAHPKLNLMVVRTGYRIDRWVYPMLSRHRGLRLETENYVPHMALEAVTERFGAECLIFGSGMPVWDAGGAMSHVLYAAVDERARRKIAGENLEGLLWKPT
jgi:predicted TIM-barrel fold metal-dependent hydrolase